MDTTVLKERCLAAYLSSLPLAKIGVEAQTRVAELAAEEIAEVIEEGELTQEPEIVQAVTERIQSECDEILVRDEDEQAIEKIVEAAMDKFLANSDLGGADPATGDEIAGLVKSHMEQIAWDWELNAHTSMKVVDDLIEEATSQAQEEIDAILEEAELDETEDDYDNEEEKEDCYA